MDNPFRLSSGKNLEDICNKYAMSLKVLQPVHFGIVDSTMQFIFDDGEWNYLKGQSLPGPCFPKYLDDWLRRYDGVGSSFVSIHSSEFKRLHVIDNNDRPMSTNCPRIIRSI